MFNDDTRVVMNKKVAYKLMRLGNVVYKTMPNNKNENYIVWVFINDDKFKKDFEEVLTEYKKNID
jgi:hypothetical protein